MGSTWHVTDVPGKVEVSLDNAYLGKVSVQVLQTLSGEECVSLALLLTQTRCATYRCNSVGRDGRDVARDTALRKL